MVDWREDGSLLWSRCDQWSTPCYGKEDSVLHQTLKRLTLWARFTLEHFVQDDLVAVRLALPWFPKNGS